eukprot:1708936-Prorocentrum_lima.AAC.1
MTSSLVGSEMCIRDRCWDTLSALVSSQPTARGGKQGLPLGRWPSLYAISVSYTHLTLPTICSV